MNPIASQQIDQSVAPAQRELAVIIPMFNEELNAERCVRAVTEVIAQLPGTALYIVNDGSRDQTASILQGLVDSGLPFKFTSHESNKGYGAALFTGAKRARQDGYEFGLFMDSDLTNDPKLISSFLSIIRRGDIDLIKASRYVETGGMKGVPWYHQIVTIVGNKIAAALFGMGLRDCTNGFRAVRLSLLEDFTPQERGFPVIMEELCWLKQRGARAAEFPYTLTSRETGQGKSKFRYRPALFYKYLKYSIKAALS